MKTMIYTVFLLFCVFSMFMGCSQNSDTEYDDHNNSITTEMIETMTTEESIDTTVEEYFDMQVRAWIEKLPDEFKVGSLPNDTEICYRYDRQGIYDVLICSCPAEPYGFAIYLTNPRISLVDTIAAECDITAESIGYRKVEIEIPDDIEFDSIEFPPAPLGTESSGVTYLMMGFRCGESIQYAQYSTMISIVQNPFPDMFYFDTYYEEGSDSANWLLLQSEERSNEVLRFSNTK